jgi:KDO2-lipid IV(A) lauroyltransferase
MRLASSSPSAAFDRVTNWAARALILSALKLPHETRVRWFGRLFSKVVAPIAGFKKRISHNLRLVMPELTEAEIQSVYRGVTDNMGRTLIETYCHDDLVQVCSDYCLSGAGWLAIQAERRVGKPVVFVSGHIGNYSAVRIALQAHGYSTGAVYRPFNNRNFDAHYRIALDKFGPTFPRGSKGTARMVRHLKAGGHVALAADQHFSSGATLEFFGRSAKSATSAAKLALKYNALLVPVYGIRRPDGVNFDVIIETPVPIGTPEAMTQALNDSLEAMIRKHPDQWLWTHKRWK